jgi:hypothetical protein
MPSLARSIENIRRTDIPTTSATTGSVNGWLFPRRNNKGNSGTIDNLQTISDELEGGLPKVLLLEAGTQDFNSPSYVQLRQTLKERFEGVSRRPREDIPTLSLKYENTSDIESLWTHQIRRFVSKHEKPASENAAGHVRAGRGQCRPVRNPQESLRRPGCHPVDFCES